MFSNPQNFYKSPKNSTITLSYDSDPSSPYEMERRILRWLEEKGVYPLSPREKQYKYFRENKLNLFSKLKVNGDEEEEKMIVDLNINKSSFLNNRRNLRENHESFMNSPFREKQRK